MSSPRSQPAQTNPPHPETKPEPFPAAILADIPHEDQICMICSIRYLEGAEPETPAEDAVTLPCGHIFGRTCIKKWLSETWTGRPRTSCPCCRATIVELPAATDSASYDLSSERREFLRRSVQRDVSTLQGIRDRAARFESLLGADGASLSPDERRANEALTREMEREIETLSQITVRAQRALAWASSVSRE